MNTRMVIARVPRTLSLLCVLLIASLGLTQDPELRERPAVPDDPDGPDPKITCASLPDGTACPDRPDRPGDCRIPVCENERCVDRPAAAGTACADTDRDPLTQPRCEAGNGRCNQRAVVLPSYTTSSPPEVDVQSLNQDVLRETSADGDCGWCCAHQTLEALNDVAEPEPAARRVRAGEPARPAKFCGEVVDYGVHDENADPRDILINIVPTSGFGQFVSGFERTVCTSGEKCIHAEITPADQFYEEDNVYLPISSDEHCDDGGTSDRNCSSFLERERSPICVYGPYAFDHGGHSVASHQNLLEIQDEKHDHPEIHPFDAIWWPRPRGNGYMFAVLQDDSNRYSKPYCDDNHWGGSNNGNDWSQAPRNMRFEFPFSFPSSQAPVQAHIQRLTTRNFQNRENQVVPLNVTTATLGPAANEGDRRRLVVNGQTLLEVVEPAATDQEVAVDVEGSIDNGVVSGSVILRVAVGCNTRGPEANCRIANLRNANPNGRHDADDAGSGYYLGELDFRAAPPGGTLEVRMRVQPTSDRGRFSVFVDGAARGSNLGNGGTTGRQSLAAGSHRVTQRPGTGTQLADYRTSFSGVCNSSGAAQVRSSQNGVCTITNVRRAPGGGTSCRAKCDQEFEQCKADREMRLQFCTQLYNRCKADCN